MENGQSKDLEKSTLASKSSDEILSYKEKILTNTIGYISSEPSSQVMDAHRYAIEVEKKLQSLNPVEPFEIFDGKAVKDKKAFDDTIAMKFIWNTITLITGLWFASFSSDYWLILSGLSVLVMIRTLGSLYDPYAEQNEPLTQIPSRFLLSKKRRAKLKKYYAKQQEYCLAVQAYQELVKAKRRNLNESGVLEIISNSCDKRPSGKMLELSDGGNVVWVCQKGNNGQSNSELTSQILKELELEHSKFEKFDS